MAVRRARAGWPTAANLPARHRAPSCACGTGGMNARVPSVNAGSPATASRNCRRSSSTGSCSHVVFRPVHDAAPADRRRRRRPGRDRGCDRGGARRPLLHGDRRSTAAGRADLPAAAVGIRGPGRAIPGSDYERGRRLSAALDEVADRVEIRTATSVLGVWGGRELVTASDDGIRQPVAERLIIAAGAYERPVPFPGWTLPGVMTAGGAQSLVKTMGVRPGRRALVSGTGPLIFVVANQLHKAGVQVVAVLEAGALPRSPTVAVDLVAVGFGLVPNTELTELAGCRHLYAHERGGWIPQRSALMETTVPGLFAVGDGAGVGGALVAVEEGRVAGITAAVQLGALTAAEAARRRAAPLRRLRSLARFRSVLDEFSRIRHGLCDLATPETLFCRCEEVERSQVEDAIREGARDLPAVRLHTRLGMGPCQGRQCAPSTAMLLSRATGRSTEEIGRINPRPPVKPVTLGALAQSPPAAARVVEMVGDTP